MRGNRANYGKRADCKRVTVRLYGTTRAFIEDYARTHNVSLGDAILLILKSCQEGATT